MTEVTIKGKGLIKKIAKTDPKYTTDIPLNGELVCVTDGDSAGLVVGDGTATVDNCKSIGGQLTLVCDILEDVYSYSVSEAQWLHTVNTSITSFDNYIYAKVPEFTDKTEPAPGNKYWSQATLVVHNDTQDPPSSSSVELGINVEGSEGGETSLEFMPITIDHGFGFNPAQEWVTPGEDTTITATIYFYKYILE